MNLIATNLLANLKNFIVRCEHTFIDIFVILIILIVVILYLLLKKESKLRFFIIKVLEIEKVRYKFPLNEVLRILIDYERTPITNKKQSKNIDRKNETVYQKRNKVATPINPINIEISNNQGQVNVSSDHSKINAKVIKK